MVANIFEDFEPPSKTLLAMPLNPIYNVFNPLGLKYLTPLRHELSHLNEHRFKYNFQDCINPLCSCRIEPESNSLPPLLQYVLTS